MLTWIKFWEKLQKSPAFSLFCAALFAVIAMLTNNNVLIGYILLIIAWLLGGYALRQAGLKGLWLTVGFILISIICFCLYKNLAEKQAFISPQKFKDYTANSQEQNNSFKTKIQSLEFQIGDLEREKSHLEFGVQYWHDLYIKSNPNALPYSAGIVNRNGGIISNMEGVAIRGVNTGIDNSGRIINLKDSSIKS